MPFFDDSGIVRENHRGPIVGGFATFGEQVERMVAVNVAWALTLFPALLALAMTEAAGWVRIALLMVSSLSVVPATGVLYALAARAIEGEQITWPVAREVVRERALSGVIALTPLFAAFIVVAWTTVMTAQADVLVVEVGLRALLLVMVVLATFWGPLHAADPRASAVDLVRTSARLLWCYPGSAIKVAVVALLVAVFGAVTVAGAVLAAPVAIALMQTNLVMELRTEIS